MNLLFAGGLLIIGVIALVALVFVIRSEPATQKSISVPPPVPTEQAEPEKHAVADEPSSLAEAQGTPEGETIPVTENSAQNELQPLVNGQLYELMNELRTIRGQTQELEYRLSSLIDMVERVEQAQNGRFPIEGQSSDSEHTQAMP